MNPILEYKAQIDTGHILVGKRVKKQVDDLVHLINHPEDNYIVDYEGIKKYYEYDPIYAEEPIDFIESFCKHVKGAEFQGKTIELELWQKAVIASLYGFVDKETRYRKYRRLHFYVARKNGKTLLAACLIIYELMMGGEMGAECYTAATRRDQAKIAWNMAKQIISHSPTLRKRFRITINTISLLPFNDSFFKPVSKESKKLDGHNAQLTHIDELHAITDTNIIDVLWDSSKSRAQPIELITTTMGTERESTFDEIYDYDVKVIDGVWEDPRLLVWVYELDDPDEWTDINMAYKANPNLGVSHSISNLHEEIQKAKNDRGKRTNLLCKSFNVRQTGTKSWLNYEDFNNTEVIPLEQTEGRVVIGGFDLSKTKDLTAWTTLIPMPNEDRILAVTKYWATENWVKEIEDKIPVRKWIEQGYIEIAGKELIDYTKIIDYLLFVIKKHRWKYMFIGYDRWSASYLINDLEKIGFSKKHVLKGVAQGAQSLSIPMQEVEADLKNDELIYQNNPVTKWCMSNVALKQDRNGNYLPEKVSRHKKIDGLATILDCYYCFLEERSYFMKKK